MVRKPEASYSTMLLFFFLFVLGTVAVISAESDEDESPAAAPTTAGLCTTKLSSDATKLLPFSTSSLKCVAAGSLQDFTLMFAQDGPNTWSFVLSGPDTGGYIAVGFSPKGKMVGSSAVAGWMMSTGTGMAHQYYLAGETSPECKPDTGSLPLVEKKTTVFKIQSTLYLAFQLNATAPPQNKLVYALGPEGKLPGKDLLLAEHAHKATATVNFLLVPAGYKPAGSVNVTDAGEHAALPETTSRSGAGAGFVGGGWRVTTAVAAIFVVSLFF